MPTIFDNIRVSLTKGLNNVLAEAQSCSFCVGYLNLRGWGQIAEQIERLPGGDDDQCCRLLVGMHRPPEEEMRLLSSIQRHATTLDSPMLDSPTLDSPTLDSPTLDGPTFDGPTLARLKRRITESFKEQLEFGVPTIDAENALRHLARQLRARKVRVKAFLGYPLHAKLYLVRRNDPVTPLVGFVGSSNLTLAGRGAGGGV